MAKGVVISVIIIGLGVAWLLNTLHVIGGVDWIWTIGLAGTGVLTLAAFSFNKLTFVAGSFLVIGSVFSILRQTGVMSVDVEVPMLMILFGVLFLVAQLPAIPLPESVIRMKEEEAKGKV